MASSSRVRAICARWLGYLSRQPDARTVELRELSSFLLSFCLYQGTNFTVRFPLINNLMMERPYDYRWWVNLVMGIGLTTIGLRYTCSFFGQTRVELEIARHISRISVMGVLVLGIYYLHWTLAPNTTGVLYFAQGCCCFSAWSLVPELPEGITLGLKANNRSGGRGVSPLGSITPPWHRQPSTSFPCAPLHLLRTVGPPLASLASFGSSLYH